MIIRIKDKLIKKGNLFVIAEAGINHNGDINTAKELIVKAKECNADAVKFQTYKTEQLVIKNVKTMDYFGMIKNYELSFSVFRELKEFAQSIGIIFLSTPDEMESLKFLIELNVPAIKIGSGEADNYRMLTAAALSKKTLLISTGASDEKEIDALFNLVSNYNKKIILMHCISEYPADIERLNLKFIKHMIAKYKCPIGFSDHTMSVYTPAIAYCMGACVIEKHFTLDKKMDGPDHKFSLNPSEFSEMVKILNDTASALGSEKRKITPKESELRKIIRKSVYSRKELIKGEELNEENTILLRPQLGIKANEYEYTIGKRARTKINKYKPVYKEDIR